MTSSTERARVDTQVIEKFVADWYAALDRHVPFEEVESYLVDGEIRFVFPETTVTTHEGLQGWYDTVTRRFFDEAHEVENVDVSWNGDVADVGVIVRWATRIWDPPEANSKQLVYRSGQSWEIVSDGTGRPRILSYTVNSLEPLGDTPPLF